MRSLKYFALMIPFSPYNNILYTEEIPFSFCSEEITVNFKTAGLYMTLYSPRHLCCKNCSMWVKQVKLVNNCTIDSPASPPRPLKLLDCNQIQFDHYPGGTYMCLIETLVIVQVLPSVRCSAFWYLLFELIISPYFKLCWELQLKNI